MRMIQFSAILAAFFALLTLATASPRASPPIEQLRKTHRVHQVGTRRGRPKSGPEHHLAAYHKYNITPPVELIAAAKEQQGSVTASPEAHDETYLVDMLVGKQNLQLIFDTGSADFWVFSTELPANERGSHTLYQLEGSKYRGVTWSVAYGDGSHASGNVYADKAVAGPVTATVQAVEAATAVSKSFIQNAADGIVGFGFDFISNTCTRGYCYTFFTQVSASLPKPVFVAVLKHNAPGHYDFGFIDSSLYTGSIVYQTVYPDNGYWQITIGGYSVGTGAGKSANFQAIADTGTSLLLLPSKLVSAYWGAVKGAKFSNSQAAYIFPCSATLPSFSLYISGAKRTMPGAYANYLSLGGGMCYGGIQSTSGGLAIIGDVFLKSQYVVFEKSTPRVGFAQQA